GGIADGDEADLRLAHRVTEDVAPEARQPRRIGAVDGEFGEPADHDADSAPAGRGASPRFPAGGRTRPGERSNATPHCGHEPATGRSPHGAITDHSVPCVVRALRTSPSRGARLHVLDRTLAAPDGERYGRRPRRATVPGGRRT